MIQIVAPTSEKEIAQCVSMMMDVGRSDFFDIDKELVLERLSKLVRQKLYVRMAKHNGEMVGWIAAKKTSITHLPDVVFRQMYFSCKAEGRIMIEVMLALHEDMLREALVQGCNLAMSECTPVNPRMALSRILGKNGWIRLNWIAFKRL